MFLFWVCVKAAGAQELPVEISFETRYLQNLKMAAQSLPGAEIRDSSQKIRKKPVRDFEEELQQIGLNPFPNPVPFAVEFYQLLEQLSPYEKLSLIRIFSDFESDWGKIFRTAGLPVELKYIPPALTAMNLNYNGPGHRAGIWQLTHFEGVFSGLQINRLVDERYNPELSAAAFVKVISGYQTGLGSPELAVLAQWCGIARVRNAISFAGSSSTEEVLKFLPDSVYRFIGAFQATAVFLSRNRPVEVPGAIAGKKHPDTVRVYRQLHFRQISRVTGIPEKQLAWLNPQYRFEIIPENEQPAKLALPAGWKDDFIIWQDSIYITFDSTLFNIVVQKIEYPPAPGRQYRSEPVKDLEIEGKTKIQYRLKTGDVLGIIAEKYDVRVEDLKYWNNIYNERRIQAGKNLDIFVDDDKVEFYKNLEKEEQAQSAPAGTAESIKTVSALNFLNDVKDARKVEYVVKKGESPYTIAKKFEGVTPEQILEWNKISNPGKIQVGQKLTIYLKDSGPYETGKAP